MWGIREKEDPDVIQDDIQVPRMGVLSFRFSSPLLKSSKRITGQSISIFEDS